MGGVGHGQRFDHAGEAVELQGDGVAALREPGNLVAGGGEHLARLSADGLGLDACVVQQLDGFLTVGARALVAGLLAALQLGHELFAEACCAGLGLRDPLLGPLHDGLGFALRPFDGVRGLLACLGPCAVCVLGGGGDLL